MNTPSLSYSSSCSDFLSQRHICHESHARLSQLFEGGRDFNKAASLRSLRSLRSSLSLNNRSSLHRSAGLAGCKSQLGGSLDMADLLRPGACLSASRLYIS